MHAPCMDDAHKIYALYKVFVIEILDTNGRGQTLGSHCPSIMELTSKNTQTCIRTFVLDAQDILKRFAFDNICKAAFNVDPGCLGIDGTKLFMMSFEDAATLSFDRFFQLPQLPKGDRFISLLKDFLGVGILNSEGDQWTTQRKTASYEFNTRSLQNFAMEMANTELHTLRDTVNRHFVLDVQDILERFTFDNIRKAAFNVDSGCLGRDGTKFAKFMMAFEDAATLSSGRFLYALPFF
nr:cytochrome P450 94A1-like [Ipomoea batatas]